MESLKEEEKKKEKHLLLSCMYICKCRHTYKKLTKIITKIIT